MSLIVLGTIALDDVQTPFGLRQNLLGGSATHFAMSARLFTPVSLAGIIGTDFPREHIDFLKQKGIDTTSIIERNGKNFHWRGQYHEQDLNSAITLATELGVLTSYSPQVAVEQKDIPFVFLANFDPDIQSQFLGLLNRPNFVALDSMNLWINMKRESLLKLMKKVHLFVANDGEARALSCESNLIKAAKRLRSFGPRFIVIKKGEHGVLFYCDQFMFSYPAYPVEEVVDPTGAGDTFAGGLMGYLSKVKKFDEESFKQAVLYATILASFNVQGFGMEKTAALTLPEVHKRMKEFLRFINHSI